MKSFIILISTVFFLAFSIVFYFGKSVPRSKVIKNCRVKDNLPIRKIPFFKDRYNRPLNYFTAVPVIIAFMLFFIVGIILIINLSLNDELLSNIHDYIVYGLSISLYVITILYYVVLIVVDEILDKKQGNEDVDDVEFVKKLIKRRKNNKR